MRRNLSSISRFFAVAVVVAASMFYASGQESEGVLFNKRPLKDSGDEVKSNVDTKKVDLSKPFLVELQGKLDAKGKLDVTASRFTRTEGDAALVETVKKGILSISDAGFLQYLKALDAKEFELFIEQSDSDFVGKITVRQASDTRAKSLATTLTTLLSLAGQQMDQPNSTDAQKRDAALIKFMSARAESNTVILSFVAPSTEIQKLVAEKLTELAKNGQ